MTTEPESSTSGLGALLRFLGWAGLAYLLADPLGGLDWPAPARAVLLYGAGSLLGFRTGFAAAVGGGPALLLGGAGLATASWWAVFVVAGELLLLAERRRGRLRGALPEVDRLTPVPLSPVDRGVTIGLSLTALVPAIVGFLIGGALPVIGGLALSAMYGWLLWTTRRLTRYRRRDLRLASVTRSGIAVAVAASPVGAWLVEFWPWPAFALPVLLVWWLVYALLLRVHAVQLLRTLVVSGGHARARWSVGVFNGNEILLAQGCFLFWATGLWHPDQQLLTAVSWALVISLVAATAPLVWWQQPVGRGMFHADLALLAFGSWRYRTETTAAWLTDAFLANPDRPNPFLIRVHAGEIETITSGEGHVRGRGDRPVATYAESAEALAKAATRRARPRLSAEQREVFDRLMAGALGSCTLAQAESFLSRGYLQDAVDTLLLAATRLDRAGVVNLGAQQRLRAALILAGNAGQPAQALSIVAPVLDAELLPLVHERARLFSLLLRGIVNGDRLTVADLTREMSASNRNIVGDDYVQLDLELEAVAALTRRIVWRPRPDRQRGFDDALGQFAGELVINAEDLTDALSETARKQVVPEILPLYAVASWGRLPARRKAEQGIKLWANGRYHEAADVLEKMATSLESMRMYVPMIEWRARLGAALTAIDPPRAYRNLNHAMTWIEKTRSHVHDPDTRVQRGDRTATMYDWMLGLLADNADGLAYGGDWPAQPRAEAFTLAERGRSRRLLEMLGESVPAPQDDLYQAERVAMAKYQAAMTELARQPGQSSPQTYFRLQATRAELEKTWGELTATGPAGAEYAQLRSGSPLTYDEVRNVLADIARTRDRATNGQLW